MWALFLSLWVKPSCSAGFFCSPTRFFWLSVIICLCGFTRSQHSEGSSVKNTSSIVLGFRAGCLTDQVSATEENKDAAQPSGLIKIRKSKTKSHALDPLHR